MELPTGTLALAETDDGLNSRSHLAAWLSDDLDDIRDPAAADEFLAFADVLRSVAEEGAEPVPAFVLAVHALSLRLADQPEDGARLAVLNNGLRAIFLAHVLTERTYEARCRALRGETSAASASDRLPPRAESLPASGMLAVFADDPREPGQCERAALLTVATLETLAGSAASTAANVLVLVRGMAYAVSLDATSRFRVTEWIEILRTICDDSATVFATRHDAWVGVVPRLATAAGYDTCESIRRLLDCDRRNAHALHGIDDFAFAVCLDAEDPGESYPVADVGLERAERLAKRFYSEVNNRWWGLPNVIVSGNGAAALAASGTLAMATVRAAEDILARSRSLSLDPERSSTFDAIPNVTPVPSSAIGRIEFREMHLGSLAIDAAREIAETFHDERTFFELDIGSAFFRDRGVSPQAALDYLIALAAREVFRTSHLPALARLVTVRGRADADALDWVAMSTRTACALLSAADAENDADDDALLVTSLEGIAFRHGVRIADARRGYSPASFLRKPNGVLETMLDDFFVETGQRHAPGYRSHFVRDGRHEAIDIVTSACEAPASSRVPAWGGVKTYRCPGTTTTAAALFWADLDVEPERTTVSMIPNARTKRRIGDVQYTLRGLVRRVRLAAERLTLG